MHGAYVASSAWPLRHGGSLDAEAERRARPQARGSRRTASDHRRNLPLHCGGPTQARGTRWPCRPTNQGRASPASTAAVGAALAVAWGGHPLWLAVAKMGARVWKP
jgi:hypothetical protein